MIAKLVPTTPAEWEESLSSSSKQSLQQCRQLSEAPHLMPLLRRLPARSLLLEAGCGLGQYVYTFASNGHRCIGLDFSYKLLDVIRIGLTQALKNQVIFRYVCSQ